MRQYLNWKTYLAIVALFIVAVSLFYTDKLARKLANEEKKKVEQVSEAIKSQANAAPGQDLSFVSKFVEANTTIPLIITDEHNHILDSKNIDTSGAKDIQQLIKEKLHVFKSEHPPIEVSFPSGKAYVYYGESNLLTRLRYFPYAQLTIIVLFLIIVVIALTSANRSLQNRVWVGLSKETAHQLGTPLSSIEAWLEILKEQDGGNEAVVEMQKDIDRLKLIADRFSKVGSAPQPAEENLITRLHDMIAYMQRRAPNKVKIALHSAEEEVSVNISGPLFDWVMENLIRNSLDAMAGEGKIDIIVTNYPQQVWIDVQDNGKGIPRHQLKKIFNPGFTTKKRGWGLGLSLSRRIIENYHHGSITVKQSEIGKGTTFRVILRR